MLAINTVPLLQQYFAEVALKANDHAGNVNQIIYPLLGFVVNKVENLDELTAWGEVDANGVVSNGNVLWFKVRNNRYVFTYSHTLGVIELKQKSLRGKLIARINNNTSINALKAIFDSL